VSEQAAFEAAIGKLASASSAGLILMPDVFLALDCKMIFALAAAGYRPYAL
jgi:hypothetical protein